MYYNHPFNLGVKTNIGKRFLALVTRQFPKKHILRQLFNRNALKISYSCTKNLRAIIQTHNQKILAQHKKKVEEKSCNCQKSKKDKCPLRGQCVQKNVIYQATTAERTPKKYIGSTELFKKRYSEHKHSFRHEAYKNSTTLSHYILEKQVGTEPTLKWEVLEHAHPYTKGSRSCGLCLAEKMYMMLLTIPALPIGWIETYTVLSYFSMFGISLAIVGMLIMFGILGTKLSKNEEAPGEVKVFDPFQSF